MSSPKKLFSINLERHQIAGLLKYPHKFHEVCQYLSAEDFADPSKVNSTLFRVIGAMIGENSSVDSVLVAQRVTNMGIRFEEGIDLFRYLESLSLQQVSEKSVEDSAKAIKKLSIRRDIAENSKKIEKAMLDLDDGASFDEIISAADKIYNSQTDSYFNQTVKPHNIFETMEQEIEALGANPPENDDLMIPNFPRTNEIYGSLFRAGNITCICSRYGQGKSSMALDLSISTAAKYNIPVLALDLGEMSLEETRNRICAALSGVPLHLIERGLWRKNKEATEKIRAIWPKVKDYKFYYYNCAGLHYTEIISLCRRWYYEKVGRGNKMILSYDYIKLMSAKGSDQFWLGVGELLEAFKTFIQKEIVFENKPMISMFTSVQANRHGISEGKKAEDLEDLESSVGLSDFIGQLSSALFFFRRKTADEIIDDGPRFGTHKLMPIKMRHLGENPARHLNLVKMPDGSLKRNYININIDNFKVSECGDLIDRVATLNVHNTAPKNPANPDKPF